MAVDDFAVDGRVAYKGVEGADGVRPTRSPQLRHFVTVLRGWSKENRFGIKAVDNGIWWITCRVGFTKKGEGLEVGSTHFLLLFNVELD